MSPARALLDRLARLPPAASPVVSVYLDTRWTDEHQRERARIFLATEVRRRRGGSGALDDDLDWIEAQGAALVAQAHAPEASGAALFACRDAGLREVLAVPTPFENAFVVGPRPHLTPLASAAEETPRALVVFVDGESARLIAVDPGQRGEEVALHHEVPGRHGRGGWAQLAQSRYQRHIEVHRTQHYQAVAEVLRRLVEDHGVERLVLAGDARNVQAFREALPPDLALRAGAVVAGARWEPAAVLAERAAQALTEARRAEVAREIDALATEAAKGGKAAFGLDATLAAIARGAVHVLYVARGPARPGRACKQCGRLAAGPAGPCAMCGGPAEAVDLDGAAVDAVLRSGGRVEVVEGVPPLDAAGGLAARLRYPLAG